MKPKTKKILSLVVMILIFAFIFNSIDVSEFLRYFSEMNLLYFSLAMSLLVPAVFIAGYRWTLLLKKDINLSIKESLEMTLVGISFNALTPSKLGDLSKAYFVRKHHDVPLSSGIIAFFFEKLLDVFSIMVFSVVGLILFDYNIGIFRTIAFGIGVIFVLCLMAFLCRLEKRPFFRRALSFVFRGRKFQIGINGIFDYIGYYRRNLLLFVCVVFLSVLMWSLYLLQIYLFFVSFNYIISPILVFSLVPIAIIVGMIPVTIAGMGTRDSALIVLFSGYAPAPLMAAVGMMISFRYFFAALVGIPFVKKYIEKK